MRKLLSVLMVTVILLTCIPFGGISVLAKEAEDQSQEATVDKVYYTDLFYAYPYYLAEDNYLASYSASIENLYSSVYESYANSPLVVGTGLENALSTITSPTEIMKLMTDAMGVTDFSYNQALDAANEEFLKNLLSNSSVLSAGEAYAASEKTVKKFDKAISIFNGLKLEDEHSFPLTVEGYVEEALGLLCESGALKHLSVDTIMQLWVEIEDGDFKLGDCFKLAETEFQIAESIVYCILLEDVRIGIVNDILATQTKGTVLYDGMSRLKSQMTNNFAVRFCEQFLKSTVADQIWGMIDSAIGKVFDTSQLNAIIKLVNVVFNAVVDVPEFAEILKWQILMCYSRELADGIPNYALKYAEGPFISDEIGNYEALFTAYDAINNATLDVAKNILAMKDPIGEAYMVFEEAVENGEETVTIKSGSLSISVSSAFSSDEFYDIMRLGVLMDYSGTTHNLGSSISISNQNTTVTIPRKANTLFCIFREGVDENFSLIREFSNSNAYPGHIASVKGTIQSVPLEERVSIPREVYLNWTRYEINDSTPLLYGSDIVQSNSVYTANGLLRGSIGLSGNAELPEGITIGGNLTLFRPYEVLGKLTVLGNTTQWSVELKVSGELHTGSITHAFYNSKNKIYVYGTLISDSSIELLKSDLSIYGDMLVQGGLTTKGNITVGENGKFRLDGNLSMTVTSTMLNYGNVHCGGNFFLDYSTALENYGKFRVDGDILSSGDYAPYGYFNNRGIVWVHNFILNDCIKASYDPQKNNATLYISGDYSWSWSHPGTFVFTGTKKQTINKGSFSTIVLENNSEEGVHFLSNELSVSTLFNHKGNAYTIAASNPKFPDYDGDSLKDNVDPQPTAHNHTYDDEYDAYCNTCGVVRMDDILVGGQTSISEEVNGLAFKFDVAALGGQVVNGNHYVNGSALVTSSVEGREYKLVRMGAVASNKSDCVLDMESVDGKQTIDIEAVYLCDLEEDSLSYAVRIINIPENSKDTDIYARPYYVYEKDGEEIVVYGDTVSQSYNAVLGK